MIKCPQVLILTIILSLASCVAWAQQAAQDTGVPSKKPLAEAPAPSDGIKYNSANHPDPFLNPNLGKKKNNDDTEEEPSGQVPPGIAGMPIDKVKLLGTVFNDAPTAVFLGTDQRSYFLLESDRLFDGYVKKIGADWVTLIRETKYRSGKIITQEVIKRLRTP
jgi:hypothetical protein